MANRAMSALSVKSFVQVGLGAAVGEPRFALDAALKNDAEALAACLGDGGLNRLLERDAAAAGLVPP